VELREAYQKVIDLRAPRLGFTILELEARHHEILDRASLEAGSGGHQAYFRQLGRQRCELRQVVTGEQKKLAVQRARGSGGWQDAYRIVAERPPA
jgi:hypothetical protein